MVSTVVREIRARRGARRDDGEVGDVAVRHRDLGSGQASAGRLQLQRPGRHRAYGLGEREAADRPARGQLRQPGLLLRFRAGREQKLGRQEHRRRERHRREGASELLGDDAELQISEPEAAEPLRNDDA
jgi:hypothetical protein